MITTTFQKFNSALSISLLALIFSSTAHAKLVQKDVEYKDGKNTYLGYLAYDDTKTDNKPDTKTDARGDGSNEKLPSILVTHDWMGITDRTKAVVDRLANLGYLAFAADIYGKGVRPKTPEEAGKLSGSYKGNRKLLREHMKAALKAMLKEKHADSRRVAVTGYCFGGTSALELARSGADLRAVVTFHGGLDSPTPADGKNIKARILALHGADDPHVPTKDVEAFEGEMRGAKLDWQLVKYGNAVHSFTDQSAGTDNSKGAAYNQLADVRSWQAMKDFLNETFAQ